MLARVADSLFWMSRYIERAENTVRLLDVNIQLLLESETQDEDSIEAHWKPILLSLGDWELYLKLYPERNTHSVMDFLTYDARNTSSIWSCVTAARENARMIRDQITNDMWAVINDLYYFLKSQNAEKIWWDGISEFHTRIREFALLFQGVTESTYLHRVGYQFINIGLTLERADKTGRILDAKHYMQLPATSSEGGVADTAQWLSVLRACGGLDAYHQVYVMDVLPEQVVEFLVLSREFPRSILYSLTRLQDFMHGISKCPSSHFSNEAEQICGRLIMDLNYMSIRDIKMDKLHELLSRIQDQIAQIAIALNARYMFFPIVDSAEEILTQAQS
jgi:uncharacterized alpha-E superfamily protein